MTPIHRSLWSLSPPTTVPTTHQNNRRPRRTNPRRPPASATRRRRRRRTLPLRFDDTVRSHSHSFIHSFDALPIASRLHNDNFHRRLTPHPFARVGPFPSSQRVGGSVGVWVGGCMYVCMYVLIWVGGSLFYLSLDIDRYRSINPSINPSVGGWVYVWVYAYGWV